MGKLKTAANVFLDGIFISNDRARHVFKKTLLGVVVFLLLAVLVIIPLLSSADPSFGQMMKEIYRWVDANISWEIFWRVVLWVISSVLLLSFFFAWGESYSQNVHVREREFSMNAISSGIVLGGVLALYTLFLGTQITRLFVNELPINFREAESFVKSGFWQLFLLSVINVIFFFLYYRNTHSIVQKILALFTVSSLLLLFSAGERMLLYVTFYGLSYEKFFASYTVLYSVVLFLCLIFFLFRKKKTDIFKFLVITFLWMFSIATVLPIEKIIFRANVALSKRENSRIDLYELRMLSNDVFPLVEAYFPDSPQFSSWKLRQLDREAKKSWHEKNIVNILR